MAACTRGGIGTLAPDPRQTNYAALDVGTRRDLTALVVGHAEDREHGRVVIIDRVLSWKPGTTGATSTTSSGSTGPGPGRTAASASARVDLAEVKAATLRTCHEYRVQRLFFDRMQAEQLTGNLRRAGITIEEFVSSSAVPTGWPDPCTSH